MLQIALSKAQIILLEFWAVICEMAPYLLFGFLVAGILYILIRPEAVERHLGGKGLLPVLKAAAFGVPLPLCSCGVLPVAASLRRHGASRGATTSFLISTPQTGVDSIFVTFSLLGLGFAIYRPIAALFSGLLGGWLVTLLAKDDPAAPPAVDSCGPECGGPERGGRIRRALEYGFVTLPRDIGPSLLVGLLVAGVITVAVPKDLFAGVLSNNFAQMLVMMALGIPMYVCASASVPVALALMAKGVSPGAALVFLMTGPATNAATIALLWSMLGSRTAVIYLASIAVSSLAAGVVLDLLFTMSGTASLMHVHPLDEMAPGPFKIAAAAVLLGILAASFLKPTVVRSKGAGGKRGSPAVLEGPTRSSPTVMEGPACSSPTGREGVGETIVLRVKGMTCSHCAASIGRALSALPGVAAAEVDFKGGTARVRGAQFDVESLRSAVTALGYEVIGAERGSS